MSTSDLETTRGWRVFKPGQKDGWESLQWDASLPLPELGPSDVLVKFRAAAMNFRDLAIVRGFYPRPSKSGVVPGADGAGEVIAIGSRVSRFQPGQKVIPFGYQSGYFGGNVSSREAISTAIGGAEDGTFREHGVFDQQGLVHMPEHLSFEEGCSLMGAGLTAWNALMGGVQPMRVGDCVLAQGTGGVSLAAVQFAVAGGATVIATTSSEEKARKLKALGAHHVINYKEDSDWGSTAKKLSPRGVGCTHVIEVGGPNTMRQSLDCIAPGGQIAVIGFLAGQGPVKEGDPSMLEVLAKMCIIRGIEVGSRLQFEEMIRVMETVGIKPVLDERSFLLGELKDAYQYLSEQQHFGKVIVKIP
ncbi:hypothetical protein NW759_014988 [Fusarium solani]|nr:hypothetical protein NW759_014988 [Fusarium solani]